MSLIRRQVQTTLCVFLYGGSLLQEDRKGLYPRSVRWPSRHRSLLAIRSEHAVPGREDDPGQSRTGRDRPQSVLSSSKINPSQSFVIPLGS